jgi:inner membrane protease subunit 1
MLPTLNEMGDVVVVDRLSPAFEWWHPITRGDIVISESSYRKDWTICKRVIGLPGDTIVAASGARSRVPEGHVWLEGDNPHNSVDSRTYGAVPSALLKGRVAARIWPLSAAGWLGPPGLVPPRPTSNTTALQEMVGDPTIVTDCAARLARAEAEAVERAARAAAWLAAVKEREEREAAEARAVAETAALAAVLPEAAAPQPAGRAERDAHPSPGSAPAPASGEMR